MAAAAAASSELLTGWCLFGLSLLAILAFCWVYVRKYQSRRESEVISTITSIFALAIALITSALLPVDIFLVSYMKNQNGTFKEWADANVSRQIEDTVLYGYYTLYSIILFSVFLWIPFVYFYYEEKDEDDASTCSQVQTALKYTLGFLMVCAILLMIGAFVPLEVPQGRNSTEWEKVKLLFEELGSSHGLAALSFSISSLTLIGMLAAVMYTAYGMSALPLNLIKGTRSPSYERLENTEDIEEVEQNILRIKSKCKDGRPLSTRHRRTLQQLEERLRTLRRRERHLELIEKSWWTKFCGAMRPLKIIWGVFFILVALLFTISLFLSNLDKALHSAGINSGFIILGTNLTNPLNMLLPVLQTSHHLWAGRALCHPSSPRAQPLPPPGPSPQRSPDATPGSMLSGAPCWAKEDPASQHQAEVAEQHRRLAQADMEWSRAAWERLLTTLEDTGHTLRDHTDTIGPPPGPTEPAPPPASTRPTHQQYLPVIPAPGEVGAPGADRACGPPPLPRSESPTPLQVRSPPPVRS
ncbi:lysosomal cobalamin transport escort protein LMBD1 isoform X2 [Carettochelys insculpta]|uniref:lysosomal cobalamin transport escort protein LMBD1 isoform X2 n=1 Tax=Carettochelys insculpta TaxID=44489 RepID=UPI003EC0A160